ncbi:gamma carbonic anhydrase family protein [Clostridiales bacterium F-3ap]|uniref:Gamma carbonic anhydrase family protein n=2 Tax=Anaerotalea alkaliphila TaxID=2662126 RepID=A0A7X5HVF0_9FIRM|nr:gamma carbonic anhydrase family protein [Anaerotalea alkaliphila]
MTRHTREEPAISDLAYVADNAKVTGKVRVGDHSSIWFGAVLRGDLQPITVGSHTNIQDNAVVHINHDAPTVIGDYVTVGHDAIVHGCTVGNNVLVGMGSIILDKAVIGDNSIVGAGSLVTQNKKFPPGVLIVGSPAKVLRHLTEQEIELIRQSALHYVENAKDFVE